MYKMEGIIALLSAAAVVYHFLAFVAYVKGFDRSFYGNACLVIVVLQITMLYTRIVTNARVFKNAFRGTLFLVANISNYSYGNERAKKTSTIEKKGIT